ncbi:MAG: globin [Gammaproteobacteria bacterium]|nr:globin [Gammaproteobacteria bacterium]
MPDASEVFRASFARAVGDTGYNDEFIQRFYDIFMAKSSEIAQMFSNTNMTVQKTMLHDSLHYLLGYYNSGVPNVHLKHIKKVHGASGANIPDRFYALWLDSLIEAVKDKDPQFDRDVEQAWRRVMAPGIEYLSGKTATAHR